MMTEPKRDFTEQQEEVLKSIRITRIIPPILIGIGVVVYFMVQQYDPEQFAKINWTNHTLFWCFASIVLLVIRHLAYATRLWILSEKYFSFKKCIELIFIWEFSSAVSPTSVGGSAVALFVLSQEKLKAAKTTAIVIYTIVLDTIFFVGGLPILLLLFGPIMLSPNGEIFGSWGTIFFSAYLLMFCYGSLFFYGLFFSPQQFKYFMVWVCKFKYLNRFEEGARKLGDDVITASKEIKAQPMSFHLGGFFSTATAWSCRFLLLNCLIIAFVESVNTDFWYQFFVYARLEAMYVIMAVAPTPGTSGLAEWAFQKHLVDIVPYNGIFIALLWRLLTYYSYLFSGAIIIPNWIREILNERSKNKQLAERENV